MKTRGKNFWRNHAKRESAKRRMLMDAMDMNERGEFGGIVVCDGRNARMQEIPEGYRGLVLYVNDHGNVSLLKAFRNGNTHEVYGIV